MSTSNNDGASRIPDEDALDLIEAAHKVVQDSPSRTSLVAGEFEGRHTIILVAQSLDLDAARRVVSFFNGPVVVNAVLTLLKPIIPSHDARGTPLFWTKPAQA